MRLALACALAGFGILSAGLLWGDGRQGFTVLGWLGAIGLAMGGLNMMRLLEGSKAWF